MAKEETGQETLERPAPAILASPAKVPTRDDLRAALLDSKGESEIVEAFGMKYEVRAPELCDLMQYRDWKTDETILARAIVNNVYDPNTGERVFEETDIPVLMKTAFSKDMKKLNAAVQKVLGGDEQLLDAVDDQTKSD